MTKFLSVLMMTFFCLLAIPVLAGNANFSGTWSLDMAKSQGIPRYWQDVQSVTLIVTQDEKTLSYESKSEPAPPWTMPVFKFNLDGTPAKIESQEPPMKAVLTGKFAPDGKVLELNNDMVLNFGGEDFQVKVTEKWELSEDGKTLKRSMVSDSSRGKMESTLIFTKK